MMTSPKVVKSLLHINATENAHYRCHAINLHVGGPSKIVKEASVNILPPYQGKYSNIFIIHVFIFMQKKNIYMIHFSGEYFWYEYVDKPAIIQPSVKQESIYCMLLCIPSFTLTKTI